MNSLQCGGETAELILTVVHTKLVGSNQTTQVSLDQTPSESVKFPPIGFCEFKNQSS